VGRMALPKLRLLGAQAGQLIDEMADIGPGDAILAIAFSPYTGETVRASCFARDRGASVIALTDSRAAPIVPGAAHVLLAPTASPQFFPSAVGAVALLEVLIACVVADGGRQVIDNIAGAGRLRRLEHDNRRAGVADQHGDEPGRHRRRMQEGFERHGSGVYRHFIWRGTQG